MQYDPTKRYCLAPDAATIQHYNRNLLRISVGGAVSMTAILLSIIML